MLSIVDHPTRGYLIGGYLIRCNRGELFVLNAEIELGGTEKTKHQPSLISDHANRLDLAGTFEGTFLPAIPSGTISQLDVTLHTSGVPDNGSSSQRAPACAESVIVVSAYSPRVNAASRVRIPTSSASQALHGFPSRTGRPCPTLIRRRLRDKDAGPHYPVQARFSLAPFSVRRAITGPPSPGGKEEAHPTCVGSLLFRPVWLSPL